MYRGQMMMAHGGVSMSCVLLVLLWVAIMYFIFTSIRTMRGHGHHHGHHGTQQSNAALDILKARYAKGEIQKEEFDTKKRDLSE